eukprot:4106107-Prymnesium_polylepis.1
MCACPAAAAWGRGWCWLRLCGASSGLAEALDACALRETFDLCRRSSCVRAVGLSMERLLPLSECLGETRRAALHARVHVHYCNYSTSC